MRRARSRARPRSTRRSASACATTSTRTASADVVPRPLGRASTRRSSRPRGRRARRRACQRRLDAVAATPPRRTQQDARDARTRARRRLARAPDRAGRWTRSPTALATRVRAAAEPDITEENLQARIRGTLLMALSNKFGWLVLTTGNKSEMSVGYTTLYGDLAGGFARHQGRATRRSSTRSVAGATTPGRPSVPRRRESDPGVDHRARAVGGAAPGPARRGLAAALRAARPHPRGLRRARPLPRGALGRRVRRRAVVERAVAWSTAPSTSAARRRPGSRSRRAPSAATGVCRSRTPTAARFGRCAAT